MIIDELKFDHNNIEEFEFDLRVALDRVEAIGYERGYKIAEGYYRRTKGADQCFEQAKAAASQGKANKEFVVGVILNALKAQRGVQS